MSIVLFDNAFRKSLFPLTTNKAVGSLFFGMLTMQKRWELISNQAVSLFTKSHLQFQYPLPEAGEHFWIDAALLPDPDLGEAILSLPPNTCLADEKGLIGGRANIPFEKFSALETVKHFAHVLTSNPVTRLQHPWQIVYGNAERIRGDIGLVTKGRDSLPIPPTVNVINIENIFIEEGARLAYCTLNATAGPIYIGRNAEVMEGTSIRGPLVLGENSVLKMNSRVYGATSFGLNCIGGGEIKNTVMMGHSNKGHDGYLGDSVIGEWCNFGAGSSNSNVKNNAGEVKMWDEETQSYLPAGQKCGVIMGDYSRTAINSAINTGSVIGISCNVFGKGLLPTVIPDFSWGVDGVRYEFDRVLKDINNWKQMKQQTISEAESSVLAYIFNNQ